MINRLAACAGMLLSSTAALAAETPPPQIVTSAQGEARLAPDRATLAVGVQTRAATAAAAARQNDARQQAVIAAIVAAGVPREQISTESYNIYPESRAEAGQNPVIVGYVVSNMVRVELRRMDQVASVIDAALGKGANQMQGLQFFSSNNDPARREALGSAIAKARGDAEAMARAAGGKVGRLLELSTAEVGPRPLYRTMTMASAASAPVEPGELTVRVSVSARWEFVP